MKSALLLLALCVSGSFLTFSGPLGIQPAAPGIDGVALPRRAVQVESASAPVSRERPAGTRRALAIGQELVLEVVWAPPGTFTMGSPQSEKGRNHSFLPGERNFSEPYRDMEAQHEVTLERGFWIGQTEITQAQYGAVTGENPSRHRGDELPVENVSWFDTQAFLAALNEGRNDGRFRLLTEAEWEYAARAGTSGPFAGGINELGWQRNNSERHSHDVATRVPNAWGMFDMYGNVSEWCEDRFGVLGWEPVSNPTGATEEQSQSSPVENLRGARVERGGAFTGRIMQCRSANRGRAQPDERRFFRGFRVAFESNLQ